MVGLGGVRIGPDATIRATDHFQIVFIQWNWIITFSQLKCKYAISLQGGGTKEKEKERKKE